MQNVNPSQAIQQPQPSQSCDSSQAAYYPNHDQYQYQTPAAAYTYASPQYEPAQAGQPSGISTWYNFSDGSYLKGFLIGAGVTLLATNPTVQKTIVKGAVKVWSMLQGGVEEVKEQIQDVKAEMSQK